MSNFITTLVLAACLLFMTNTVHAETDSNSQTIIEMAEITIRMTNNHPTLSSAPAKTASFAYSHFLQLHSYILTAKNYNRHASGWPKN